MINKTTYKPVNFFLITFLITWGCLFIASYLSYKKGMENIVYKLIIAGTFGPLIAAFIMHYRSKSPHLWKDFWDRLINFKRIKLATLPLLLFLMPLSIIISISISLLFGMSTNQFTITLQGSFSMGGSVMFLMVLVPVLEEIGWRGYGVDSLRNHFNLFKTSILFGVIWAIWHAPLFLVKNTYMHGLLSNWVYVVNYFAGVIVLAFVLNWFFYKNNRSVLACCILHIIIDVTGELFAVTKYTKMYWYSGFSSVCSIHCSV